MRSQHYRNVANNSVALIMIMHTIIVVSFGVMIGAEQDHKRWVFLALLVACETLIANRAVVNWGDVE